MWEMEHGKLFPRVGPIMLWKSDNTDVLQLTVTNSNKLLTVLQKADLLAFSSLTTWLGQTLSTNTTYVIWDGLKRWSEEFKG